VTNGFGYCVVGMKAELVLLRVSNHPKANLTPYRHSKMGVIVLMTLCATASLLIENYQCMKEERKRNENTTPTR